MPPGCYFILVIADLLVAMREKNREPLAFLLATAANSRGASRRHLSCERGQRIITRNCRVLLGWIGCDLIAR